MAFFVKRTMDIKESAGYLALLTKGLEDCTRATPYAAALGGPQGLLNQKQSLPQTLSAHSSPSVTSMQKLSRTRPSLCEKYLPGS